MKMLIYGIAAAFAATAAIAQMTPPPPVDPMAAPPAANPMTPAPAADPMAAPPAAEAAPAAPPAPAMGADGKPAPALVEKNGKWWNGDRRATNAEIAEYRLANPK